MTERPERAGTGQPRGTVTFLFSDIEGSTRLLQALGSRAYSDVLERHRTLLRQAFRARGGYEVECEGTNSSSPFNTPATPSPRPPRRSCFSPTSPGQEDASCVCASASTAVNRCSLRRVRRSLRSHCGPDNGRHGGQVILSQAALECCSADLPANAVLSDLGEHQLKDIPQPERLHQLVVPGLPHDFPPPAR